MTKQQHTVHRKVAMQIARKMPRVLRCMVSLSFSVSYIFKVIFNSSEIYINIFSRCTNYTEIFRCYLMVSPHASSGSVFFQFVFIFIFLPYFVELLLSLSSYISLFSWIVARVFKYAGCCIPLGLPLTFNASTKRIFAPPIVSPIYSTLFMSWLFLACSLALLINKRFHIFEISLTFFSLYQ